MSRPRPSFDEVEHAIRPAPPADMTGTLFDIAPDIRTPAPHAPGSLTSEAAAEAITNGPFRRASWRKIMLALAAAGRPLTREELSERTGLKDCSLCGRLSDRELRPEWVRVADQVMGSSGVEVDRYELTPAGRARCALSNIETRGAA